jgi:hypothetical protein
MRDVKLWLSREISYVVCDISYVVRDISYVARDISQILRGAAGARPLSHFACGSKKTRPAVFLSPTLCVTALISLLRVEIDMSQKTNFAGVSTPGLNVKKGGMWLDKKETSGEVYFTWELLPDKENFSS